MKNKEMEQIRVGDLATEFDLRVVGNRNGLIDGPGSLKKQSSSYIYWLKHPKFIDRIPQGNIIISNDHFEQIEYKEDITYLVTAKRPRLVFAEILQKIYMDRGLVLSRNQVEVHRNNNKVFISDNVYIAEDVKIGDGTIVHPNVVIHNGTTIGRNCVIKANTTLGTEGMGYETNSEGNLVKFPQIGGVILGDSVEIGPNSTVRRGALDDTIVGNNVKIGAFCNIGHNCEIGDNTILTCQCVTGGSSIIGNNVSLGIQSSIKNGVTVGSNCIVGAGAVVIKPVLAGVTVVGNPAIPMEQYKKWSFIRKKLIGRSEGA
ncbi:hypothetical protein N9B82_00080 [Saprospiraceae bacterium]|nr:hypothetical protein [Saprospiraceae bacterium]